ncbi:hypothetical protein EGR_07229 [Echinococcus granulosus]|uniref:Uncharacterized protein n=1 Tax=Echinococcus granulosus TaxID=6210 RepID=W6UID3_ECHGR|nr:hypothetical protein EGR_07229 [Echinococcus granulosus]EUB57867.1 hypothetical protein EGR_07229 [Echinococcus granulosus]
MHSISKMTEEKPPWISKIQHLIEMNTPLFKQRPLKERKFYSFGNNERLNSQHLKKMLKASVPLEMLAAFENAYFKQTSNLNSLNTSQLRQTATDQLQGGETVTFYRKLGCLDKMPNTHDTNYANNLHKLLLFTEWNRVRGQKEKTNHLFKFCAIEVKWKLEDYMSHLKSTHCRNILTILDILLKEKCMNIRTGLCQNECISIPCNYFLIWFNFQTEELLKI